MAAVLSIVGGARGSGKKQLPVSGFLQFGQNAKPILDRHPRYGANFPPLEEIDPHGSLGSAMTTTLLNVSGSAPCRETAGRALREAGLDVVEVGSWDEAAAAAGGRPGILLIFDGASLPGGKSPGLPRDVARSLSHDLRTPLSAMAGWIHLLESGKLDEAGIKRALGKLRGNIDDQVKTIERYLGSTQEGQR